MAKKALKIGKMKAFALFPWKPRVLGTRKQCSHQPPVTEVNNNSGVMRSNLMHSTLWKKQKTTNPKQPRKETTPFDAVKASIQRYLQCVKIQISFPLACPAKEKRLSPPRGFEKVVRATIKRKYKLFVYLFIKTKYQLPLLHRKLIKMSILQSSGKKRSKLLQKPFRGNCIFPPK